MRWIHVISLLQLALVIAPSLCSPQTSEGDVVTISIRVLGPPPNVSSRVYLNGTSPTLGGRQLTVNSSKPLTITLRRGSTISIALDAELSDSLGNVYTLSWIEYDGNKHTIDNKYPGVTFRADRDVELSASYSWSHVLLSPLLWPFYALLLLLVVHRWLRSRRGSGAGEGRAK